MKLYRFSPIHNKEELFSAINHIHIEGHKLCLQSFGKYFANGGNLGVFCHYDKEFALLKKFRAELTLPSDNPDQKYFELIKPIIFPAQEGLPEVIYTHLYIRRPDPYRHHVGDLDFYLPAKEYQKLKSEMQAGKIISGARIYYRPDLDMIELYNPDIDVLSYISTTDMTKTVRVKQSELTKL